jgi:hypothetical protein
MKYVPGPKAIPVPVETLCTECGRKSERIQPLFTGVHCPWCKGEMSFGTPVSDDLVWLSNFWP